MLACNAKSHRGRNVHAASIVDGVFWSVDGKSDGAITKDDIVDLVILIVSKAAEKKKERFWF